LKQIIRKTGNHTDIIEKATDAGASRLRHNVGPFGGDRVQYPIISFAVECEHGLVEWFQAIGSFF
jgi:hypothetical protein